MTRYSVFINGMELKFNDEAQAEHYARLNAGTVIDNTTMEVVAQFKDDNDD